MFLPAAAAVAATVRQKKIQIVSISMNPPSKLRSERAPHAGTQQMKNSAMMT